MCHHLPNIHDILNCFFNKFSKHLYENYESLSSYYILVYLVVFPRSDIVYSALKEHGCLHIYYQQSLSQHHLQVNGDAFARCHELRARWIPLWCVGEKKVSSSAVLFILLFAVVSYALQSCSLIFPYVGSEIEFIFMHRQNDFIASNPQPISRKATIARTFISNMFLPCF